MALKIGPGSTTGLAGWGAVAGLALAAWLTCGAAVAASRYLAFQDTSETEVRPAGSEDPNQYPVAVAARLSDANGVTSLVFDLSRAVALDAFLLDKPDRLIVDLPKVDFRFDPAAAGLDHRAVGLVHSVRFGMFAAAKSRIVVDLAGPAVLRRASVDTIAGGEPSRLTIELARTDRTAFKAALRREPVAAASAGAAADPPVPILETKPVIVIDPGHGGVDPGASGAAGVIEKTVVFDFGRALADKLTAGGRYKVVMTRTDDTFVSLGDRVKVAREAGAALFVSVHADTLSDPTVTGATVYTASDRASDAEAARVAASENRADEVAGLDAAPDSPGLSDILFDLTRRETRTYAHMFQRNLIGYWQKIARLNKRPDRSAGFKVLQAPDVPSVLLELGYLSSDRDSQLLTSADWRDKASSAVVTAIDAFFAQRRTPSPSAATSAPAGPPPPPAKLVSVQSHL